MSLGHHCCSTDKHCWLARNHVWEFYETWYLILVSSAQDYWNSDTVTYAFLCLALVSSPISSSHQFTQGKVCLDSSSLIDFSSWRVYFKQELLRVALFPEPCGCYSNTGLGIGFDILKANEKLLPKMVRLCFSMCLNFSMNEIISVDMYILWGCLTVSAKSST